MNTILFWDIDGTLLTTARAGIFAWEDAVQNILNLSLDLQLLHTAGLTDLEIARLIIEKNNFHHLEKDTDQKLLRYYEYSLPKRLPERIGEVLPNIIPILEALKTRSDVTSFLLTGNTKAGAKAKLTHYGLSSYFEKGAFSDDGENRPEIARSALQRAKEFFTEKINLEHIFVIGDTPYDIICGKEIGAKTIAVASGVYSQEDLEQHHPWWICKNLPDPLSFLRKLGLECHA